MIFNAYEEWTNDKINQVRPHKVNLNHYSLLVNNIEEVEIKMFHSENHCGKSCDKDCHRFHFTPTHYLCLDGMPLAKLVGVDELNHIIHEFEQDDDERVRLQKWKDLTQHDYRNQYTTSLPVKMDAMLDEFVDESYIKRNMDKLDKGETIEIDGQVIHIKFTEEEE